MARFSDRRRTPIKGDMPSALPADRLLAIIRTQSEIATSDLDVETVMALVLDRAQELTGASSAVVELAEGDEMVYHVARGAAAEHVGLRLRADSSMSGMCVREGRVLHCDDAAEDPRVNYEACLRVGAVSMACVPLAHGGRTIGVLKVYDPRAHAFDLEDIQTLELLTELIGARMAHAAEFESHRRDSRHDQLTGLLNRRALAERLGGELSRSRRHGTGLAVAVLDLDGFKAVNDTEGHAAGDAVLQAVAKNLFDLRREDSVFRLGGDEFAVILISVDPESAQLVIARVQHAIAEDPECRGVTVAAGVATFGPADDAASILARADAALYAAKRARTSPR
jgi:diguanylate cyclase (GGDEF)-like protein